MRRAAAVVLALLASCAHAPCFADGEGVRVSSLASMEAVLAGDAEPTTRPAFELEVDGPLAFGQSAPLRVYVRFRLFGLPGEDVDLHDVRTFRAAELNLGAYRRIGALTVGGQEVWTSLEAEWGFATLTGEAAAEATRYPRHYGAGLRLDERRSGAWLSLLYGRHEAAGPWGWGQWLISGGVPLVVSRGALVLGGDAVLAVGPDRGQGARDVFRLYIALDPAQVAALVRK